MPFTREQLIEKHGEIVRSEPLVIERKGATGSLGRRPPVVTNDAFLYFGCGAIAELSFGSYNETRPCDKH